MRAVLVLLLALVPSVAVAQAPFDLRALRAEWPGMGRVVLEQEFRVTPLDDGVGLRVAVRSSTAVLSDDDREDLNLFEEPERPGCRTPGGLRIEVVAPDGSVQVRDQSDFVRIARGAGGTWTSPRPGVMPGAVIHESFHVDYSARCFGGLAVVSRTLGHPKGPVLAEAVIVDCPGCAVAFRGGEGFTAEEGRRVLRRARVLPWATEPHRPPGPSPRFFVSNAADPLALGVRLAEQLAVQRPRWRSVLGSWRKEGRSSGAAKGDPTGQLVAALSAGVHHPGPVWKRAFAWGDPVAPRVRPLEPTEWLVLATELLARAGAVPLLLGDTEGPVPEGVASIFSWDDYGVLLPDRGVLTTSAWIPFAPGTQTAQPLARREAILLEPGGPRLHSFPEDPAVSVKSWDVTLEPSGSSSLLVLVDYVDAGSWGALRGEHWLRMEQSARAARGSVDEAARSWAAAFFDGRRLAGTRVAAEDGGLRIETAWTVQGGQRLHDGGMSVAVPALGLDPWIRVLDADRLLPMQLGASRRRGTVRVKPVPGYRIAGVPGPTSIGDDAIRLRAAWTRDGADALLTWSLDIDRDVLPADQAGEVAAVGAALRRLAALSLVLDKE